MQLIKKVETQIQDFISRSVQVTPDIAFSQYETIKRILLFQNNKYPTGNVDSLGDYKYYYDIISPRVDNEIKNIDLDTKDIRLYSENKNESSKVFLANSALKDYLKDTQQGVLLNNIVEGYSAMGNTVLKKVKDGYELWNPLNFFLTNPAAKTLEDTGVIERHNLNADQLRNKKDVWDSEVVDDVLENCGNKGFSGTENESLMEDTETKYYEIYEVNDVMSIAEYKEAKGDEYTLEEEEEYILAKVIFAGLDGSAGTDSKYVLFADEIKKKPYLEAHRGRYEGRWFRKGIYEILFDIQIRSNACGNKIAHALDFGALQAFWSPDSLIYKNIMTDLQRGDIIKTTNLQRVPTEMRDINNYVTEWNLISQQADKLTNSYEVTQGDSMPSGTPFRLGAMLNVNANKLFDFLREKLALCIKQAYEDWIVPDLLKELKGKEVLKLTKDPEYVKKFKEMMVEAWYLKNVLAIGPHEPEMADLLKVSVMDKLNKNEDFFVKLTNDMWKGFKPSIMITGESMNIEAENQKRFSFVQLETDPVRRTALLEELYALNGIDVSAMPKSEEPQPVSTPQPRVPVATQTEGAL